MSWIVYAARSVFSRHRCTISILQASRPRRRRRGLEIGISRVTNKGTGLLPLRQVAKEDPEQDLEQRMDATVEEAFGLLGFWAFGLLGFGGS